MVDSILAVIALAAAPLAAITGVFLGRFSADAAARIAAGIAGAGWIVTLFLAGGRAVTQNPAGPGWFGLRVDTLAMLMLMLVLGLSAIIQCFAVRYLRGDRRQVWFVVTANLVTASTALMVSATSILGFGIAWIAAGVSLIGMLATYPQLPQARDGVRRTAVRVLIGDAAIVTAVVMLMIVAGGDVPFTELRSTLAGVPSGIVAAAAILLVIPALARSSQVPFHGWLPATLAAPTPVSALMHAGIVNAGAILVVRFSPVVGESALAMSLLFGAGAATLVYASVVRLVKPDVKGRLVFSTMAQMGFMVMACGMGAFAAAIFHLIAHGLFKSALFLGAGSVISRHAEKRAWPVRRSPAWPQASAAIVVAVVVPIVAIILARTLLQLELSAASQALQLFVVFTGGLALGTTLWNHFTTATVILGSLAVTALTFGYSALVHFFDLLLPFPPVDGKVDAAWLLLPAVALLALPLLTRPSLGGTRAHVVTDRLYAAVLGAGSPTALATRYPDTARAGHPERTRARHPITARKGLV